MKSEISPLPLLRALEKNGAQIALPRIVGIRRAHDLILTNRKLTAAEAEQWGLVNYVVDDVEFTEESYQRILMKLYARGGTDFESQTPVSSHFQYNLPLQG